MKTNVTDKVLLAVTSWENDGDNYSTKQKFVSKQIAKEICDLLISMKGIGNEQCSDVSHIRAADLDTYYQWVGVWNDGEYYRNLDNIKITSFSIEDGVNIIASTEQVEF